MRNGFDQPIELYNLENDPGESADLASERADVVAKAERIFNEAHQPDRNWPLDRRTTKQQQLAKQAWRIKKQRDQSGWVPETAK